MAKKMKIALYYPWVYLTSGAERTILEITTRSRHKWTIFTHRFDRHQTFPELSKINLVELLPKASVKRTFSEVIKTSINIAKQKLDLRNFDVLVVLCEGVGDFIMFRNNSIPVVCICLTPLRPVFDEYYKKKYLEGKGRYVKIKLQIFGTMFKIIDKLLWKNYQHIFCISNEVKNRILKGRLTKEDKLEVVYPGIDYNLLKPTWQYEKFFLIPGRIMWTKNIELGIKAFKLFIDQNPIFQDFRLIIAGIVDEKSKPYFKMLQTLTENDERIEFKVHLSDRELFSLYQRCYSVLFTAFNEDWGIVPLEGMAFGKPIIAVNRGGPRESIINNYNGFLVEPTPKSFSDVMSKLAGNFKLVLKMGKAARAHVAKYDWNNFVKKIDNYLENYI